MTGELRWWEYGDPANVVEIEERITFKQKQGCFACEKRPVETGGTGACKKHVPRKCGSFRLDEGAR